jgi:epoxyqueuosine reductase QueG
MPPTYNYDEVNLCSDWSHRSAAYIAGVGTFGINHMLITPAGCCGRIGSVITDLELPPTPKLEEELCLFKRNGTCGLCMCRCVAGTFSLDDGSVDFNVRACNEQIYGKVYPNRPQPGSDSCGKCMVGVPCSSKDPTGSLAYPMHFECS